MKIVLNLIIVAAIAVAGLATLASWSQPATRTEYPPLQTAQATQPRDPYPYAAYVIALSDTKFSRGQFGLVKISGKLQNIADSSAKDVEISCTLIGPSGTTIKTLRETVFVSILAKATERFKDITMGIAPDQSNAAQCSVSKVTYEGRVIRG